MLGVDKYLSGFELTTTMMRSGRVTICQTALLLEALCILTRQDSLLV